MRKVLFGTLGRMLSSDSTICTAPRISTWSLSSSSTKCSNFPSTCDNCAWNDPGTVNLARWGAEFGGTRYRGRVFLRFLRKISVFAFRHRPQQAHLEYFFATFRRASLRRHLGKVSKKLNKRTLFAYRHGGGTENHLCRIQSGCGKVRLHTLRRLRVPPNARDALSFRPPYRRASRFL